MNDTTTKQFDGDALAKAEWTVKNCDEKLAECIITSAIRAGYTNEQVNELSSIINKGIIAYKEEKEQAVELLNNYRIQLGRQ